ncbi:hypothetical protein DENSPDRAFT_842656 [Dentipellis sp. KUC8613]|nr:hypothetical protein DENSPDRAFT_842656 [Dentipellis sp. KUC8613]
MSIIPGLNEDCAMLVLKYMEAPSLLSMALTCRAAIHPVRLRLLHDPHLPTGARAASFLTFVLNHSLEPALRILRFDVHTLDQTDSWPALADVLQRATNLFRLEAYLNPTSVWPEHGRIFGACEQRFFHALVDLTPALTHLHLSLCHPLDLAGLHGVRGLKHLWLSTSFDSMQPEMMASNMSSIKDIIANNADTLEDISLTCPNSKASQIHFDPSHPCARVTRFAFRAVCIDYTNLCEVFPNVQRLEQSFELRAPEDLGDQSPVWPALTTLVMTDVVLQQPLLACGEYPLLRRFVVGDIRFLYTPAWFQGLLEIIRRFRIYELSLRDVLVPPEALAVASQLTDDVVTAFLSQLLESAPHLRKLDLGLRPEHFAAPVDNVIRVVPDAASHAYALRNLASLSLSTRRHVRGALSRKRLEEFARAWFTVCPVLVHIRVSLRGQEFRWTRHWETDADNKSHQRSVVTPQYRVNARPGKKEDEASVFAGSDDDWDSAGWSSTFYAPRGKDARWVKFDGGTELVEFSF